MNKILIFSLSFNLVLSALLYFSLKRLRKIKKNQIKEDGPLSSGADLFNDMTKSKTLYKLLKKEVHPERFIGNDALYKYAEEKMMQIGECSNSYTAMIEIVEEMKSKDFPFSKSIETI
jgi:hypothetical protein